MGFGNEAFAGLFGMGAFGERGFGKVLGLLPPKILSSLLIHIS